MASKLWVLVVLMVLPGCGTGDSVDSSLAAAAATSTSVSPSTTTTSTTTTSMATSTTTTTVTPEPPTLGVTDPQPDAVVTTAVYTFQGVTDPGCTVDVGGKYFADVDADGAWTLDLVLRPGANATTVTATTTVGAKTAVEVSLTYAPFVLRSDGLGIVSIGDPMGAAIAALTNYLGAPSGDRVDEAPFGERGEMGGGMMACWTATGTTCIDYFRIVSWDEVGLYLVFSDWTESAPGAQDWEPVPAPPNLRGYAYQGGANDVVLTTQQGVTIGSTVSHLVEAYGTTLRFSDEECAFNLAGFQVIGPADDLGNDGAKPGVHWGLWGELNGPPDAPTTIVISIGAGSLLGHC